MTSIIASLIATLFIVLSAVFVFSEYSKSAVALARHDLFKARDRLFAVARDGHVDFDHPGYRAARDMINCLIRYAHDLSLTQLVLTRLLKRLRRIKPTGNGWDQAVASLPKAAKAQVEEVLDDAMLSMFRLMITRSIVLSASLSLFVVGHAVGLACHRALKSARTTTSSHPAEAVMEDLYSHSRRFRPTVKQEAKRYRFQSQGLSLQAA